MLHFKLTVKGINIRLKLCSTVNKSRSVLASVAAILMQCCFKQNHCKCFKSPTTAGSYLLRTIKFHKIQIQYIQRRVLTPRVESHKRRESSDREGSSFAFKHQVGVTVFRGCQKSVFLWRPSNLNYIKMLVTIINHNISSFAQSPSQLAEDSALHNFHVFLPQNLQNRIFNLPISKVQD